MTPKQDYDLYMEQARQYLKAATGGLNREAVFTPEILYNILGMAIEKYCMALFLYKRCLPFNHTFLDFIETMDRVVAFPADLKEELKTLQGYQELCSADAYVRTTPDRAVIVDMVETARRLESFVTASCAEGDGEMGRWGDGETGRRGDGETRRWGDAGMRGCGDAGER